MKKKMTVKELIEELKQYPEDTEVRMVYWGHDNEWDQWFDACSEPYVKFEMNYSYYDDVKFWWTYQTKDLVIIYD